SSRYGIEDIEVPKEWRGKSLLKLDIRKKYGVNVIAVKSRDSEKVISPPSDYVFAAGDIAVIAGENECIRRIKY
ncbi:MAG: TrkA family potassium uptake protein, partial [Firmicutes bacterium]|nr:TrkA family potassium uptake protein [Bacillota bacterium]